MAIIDGDETDNRLSGSRTWDQINGWGGDDTLVGRAGNDVLYGGTGRDRLLGGDGDDHLSSDGVATMLGGGGDDFGVVKNGSLFKGGAGRNSAVAFTDDTPRSYDFSGYHDGDRLRIGGAGVIRDVQHLEIYFGAGADSVQGGDGTDALWGGGGDDRLTAGATATTLVGGLGDDVLTGGEGRDLLYGDNGSDTLTGGGGVDRFAVSHPHETDGAKVDLITDLANEDWIQLPYDSNTVDKDRQPYSIVEAFDGIAGELTLTYVAEEGITTIAADRDGDRVADLLITAEGDHEDFTHFL